MPRQPEDLVTRQTSKPLQRHNLPQTNTTARELVRSFFAEGLLDLDPPYQRDHVWSLDQRIELVRTWVEGLPCGIVTLNNRDTAGWASNYGTENRSTGIGLYGVIDGKQRITTAVLWFTGKLAVPASWFEPEDVVITEDTDDDLYVRFTGLSANEQRRLGTGAMLPVHHAKVATIAEEAEIFMRLNGGGTAQTAEDMDRAAAVSSEM